MIQTTAQAIKFLKGIGFFVRVATLEEKRPLAREAKTKAHAPRRGYVSGEAKDIHDNFCKKCFTVFSSDAGWGGSLYGPRNLIQLAKAFAKTVRDDRLEYKTSYHRNMRIEGKKIIRESLNEMYNAERERFNEECAMANSVFEEKAYRDYGDYLMGCYAQDELDYDRMDFVDY